MTQSEQKQYIASVHYRRGGRSLYAYAAVLCADRMDFDKHLSEYLEAQGAALLWTEEVLEAVEWLGKFGHNSAVTGLARKVSEKVPVAMSEGKAEAGSTDDDFLVIEEIEGVEPLDAQFGTWPKLTVPAALQEAMFGAPAPTDAEQEEYGEAIPPMATYAILDSAKLPYVLTANLENSGLEYQSLFQGAAQEELGDHAPYIVRLEEENTFVRKLFTTENAMGLWEKELGIFIRSRASLSELRKHFRKFTRVQDENGKWYYFRFWEGAAWGDLFTAKKVLNQIDVVYSQPFIQLVCYAIPQKSRVVRVKYDVPAERTKIDFQELTGALLNARLSQIAVNIPAPTEEILSTKYALLQMFYNLGVKKPRQLKTLTEKCIEAKFTPESVLKKLDLHEQNYENISNTLDRYLETST